MPKSINLTGSAGRKYDLDELSTKDVRTASAEELIVQIWYWNPNGINAYIKDEKKFEEHRNPNPPNLQVGQIWLSKLVPQDFKEE